MQRMNNPQHSIIVPAYNTGATIRRCVDSIIAQSCENWELILVDDGSKDITSDIVDEYARMDERIRAIHIPNGGVSRARNVGLQHAKGEYVMFVDSDDWIEPDYRSQVEKHREDDADIYMMSSTQDCMNEEARILYSSIKGSPVYRLIDSEAVSSELGYMIETLNMEACWSKSFRLDFVRKHGIKFHEEMIVFEDYCFVLQCLLHKSKISLVPYVGYHYMTNVDYNPVVRRKYRDLYPSIHSLFLILERLDETLNPDAYSHEVLMRIMTSKISVVLLQSLYAKSFENRVKPFKLIHTDSVLNRHLGDVMRYGGGKRRLQYRFMCLRLYFISYILYKYL